MADSKITALASIGTGTDPANDPLVIVDVSDVSPGGMSATGTTKKVTLNNLLSSSPTATGNFTITGDLTVDTSTLKVDSANNRVGFGTATPYALAHANGTIASANFDWTSTFTAPAVGLLAASNSSSAYIRIATLDSNPTHDPFINFLTSGGQNWSVGIDNSDSDKFKIALTNGFTGSSEIFAADPSGVFSWYDGAGGTRMTLNSTGLGVGATPSSYKLTVAGTGYFSSTLTLDGASRLSAAGTNALNLNTNSVDRLTIDSSGNVGIGATSPNISASGKALTIAGAFTRSRLELQNTDGGTGGVTCGTISWFNGSNLIADITGAANSGSATLGSLAFSTGGSPRLTIDSSGNVISNVTGTAPTLATNSQMVFNLTSNTNLRISVRGSDGVTRTANITLA